MKLCAVIQAAGFGKRLGALTASTPKPLLEVSAKPLLHYSIDFARALGAQRIIVVAGFQFERVKHAALTYEPSALVLETDPRFHTLDGFSKTFPHLDGYDVLVCDADFIFMPSVQEATKKQLKDFSLFCSYDTGAHTQDVMKVKTDKQQRVLELSKTLTEFDAIYNGVWFFEKHYTDDVKRFSNEVLELTDKTQARIETMFQRYVTSGNTLFACDVGAANWHEIDTQDDLLAAKKALET